MVVHVSPDDLSGFAKVHIHSTTYKTVKTHDIRINVLIPKTLTSIPFGNPIILRLHGGGLLIGDSLTPLFFQQHILDLATLHSAIIVSPNYRLLPEATLPELLSDIHSAWSWIHASLPGYLAALSPPLTANLTRILLAGESAGGYLALQLALSNPTHPSIRALHLAYPMTDLKSPWFASTWPGKQVLDLPPMSPSVLTDHIASLTGDEVISSDLKLERFPIMASTIMNGLYGHPRFFPRDGDQTMFPLERLESGEKLPNVPVSVIHGASDSVCEVEQSRELERVVRAQQGGEERGREKFVLVVREGAEHGFDTAMRLEEEGWLREAWEPLVRAWLD
jgi:acetyl esterase/lipase